MSWFYLILAGLLEAFWAIGLKYTHGFTRLVPSMVVAAAILASMLFLSLALREIPVAIGYAIWVSLGILGAALAGPILYDQPLQPGQTAFLILLILAVVGLRFTSPAT